MLVALLPLLLTSVAPLLWTLIAYSIPYDAPQHFANTNITLVIAHPDDEVMFFGPTLNRIAHPRNNNSLSIVCLSTGDSEGLGEVRKAEMAKSADSFLVDSAHLTIIDDEKLPDSMEIEWDAEYVADILEKTVQTDKLVTFDEQGVSDHSNHKTLYHAAQIWKNRSSSRKVWTLTSSSIYRKYLGNFDSLFTYFVERYARPEDIIVVAQQGDYQRTKRTMSSAHKSQMKWFRYLWIMFSRYMYVNNLVEMQ
jgi:N-acetylglucosaminylphosphatidylinositol deacetylase